MRRPATRFLIPALVCVCVAVGALFCLNGFPDWYLSRTRAKLQQGAEVGWSRAEVIRHLGKPWQDIRTEKDYNYWRKGPSYVPNPTFAFQKEVLVYTDYVWRMYVGIGENGRVTHVHMART